MIRIYCQYSFGGFRTFHVNGKSEEKLEQEVLIDCLYDFPMSANCFFNRGGAKIAYKHLDNGELTLAVKEIPSLHKDTDGRPINCAVQFIGSSVDDRKQLDNMAIAIANDINGFEMFFADLFYVRQGLRIKGNELIDYINAFKATIFSGESPLLDITIGMGKWLLFVPISSNFNENTESTNRICEDLDIKNGDIRNCLIISYQELMHLQKRVVLKGKGDVNDGKNSDKKIIQTLQLEIKLLEKRIEQQKQENVKFEKTSKTILYALAISLGINIIMLFIILK